MLQLTVRKMLPSRDKWLIEFRELLHHGRRVGKEEKIEIRVVSGETNLILHSLHKANVFTLLKYL